VAIPYDIVMVHLLPGDVVSMVVIRMHKPVQKTDGFFVVRSRGFAGFTLAQVHSPVPTCIIHEGILRGPTSEMTAEY
jgi:hypothetical protein